jgi:hypothetical protein
VVRFVRREPGDTGRWSRHPKDGAPVSEPVALDALRDRIGEFGPAAYLVTVSAGGKAHVVSARPAVHERGLRVDVGNTSRANATANPAVTLLWTPDGAGAYSLIVDGTAEMLGGGDDALLVVPTRAVLHRIAGTSGDGPGCVPVE